MSESPTTERSVPDFQFRPEGSIGLLEPTSPEAWAWVNENVLTERDGNPQLWFGRSLVIAHSCIGPLLVGVSHAGLTFVVKGNLS